MAYNLAVWKHSRAKLLVSILEMAATYSVVGIPFPVQSSGIENTQPFGWKLYMYTIANDERPYIICNCFWLKLYIEFSLNNQRHRLVECLWLRTSSWVQSTSLVKTQTHGCGKTSFFLQKIYLKLRVSLLDRGRILCGLRSSSLLDRGEYFLCCNRNLKFTVSNFGQIIWAAKRNSVSISKYWIKVL